MIAGWGGESCSNEEPQQNKLILHQRRYNPIAFISTNYVHTVYIFYIEVSSVDEISVITDELRNDFKQVRSNKFSRKMSVLIVSMRGYTKKLMEGKEKTMRSHIRGGLKGPEVRIVRAGGVRKVKVKVMPTTQEAKWPSELTMLRWCLLVDMLCLFLMM